MNPGDSAKTSDFMGLRDLVVRKAQAIERGGKWRDYVDVYFLLKEKKITLSEIIEIAQERCGGEFSSRLFLQQLSYFGDITDYKIDFIGPEVEPEIIKQFLINETKVFLQNL